MRGASLDGARAALDDATGRPGRRFWIPVSLAILDPARVTTCQFGSPSPRVPSALPSWPWPPVVCTAVLSALAEAAMRDLTDADDIASTEGASA